MAEFRFEQDVAVDLVNSDPKGWKYVQLCFNESLVLTFSYLPGIRGLPRHAKFRNDKAAMNPRIYQPDMLSPSADPKEKCTAVKDRFLYGIVVHGSEQGRTLDFAFLKIPDFDYQRLLHSDNIAQLISESNVTDIEHINPVQEIEKTNIQLRRRQIENPESDRKSGTGDLEKEDGVE